MAKAFIILLLAAFSFHLQGQSILGNLKNKINKKVNEKVNEKIDRVLDGKDKSQNPNTESSGSTGQTSTSSTIPGRERPQQVNEEEYWQKVDYNKTKNALHNKYEKQIVFTTKTKKFDELQESDFISSYDLKGPLYMYIFMEEPLRKQISLTSPMLSYVFKFYLDNEFVYSETLPSGICTRGEKDEYNVVHWELELKNLASKQTTRAESAWGRFLIKAEKKLTLGKHTIKLEVEGSGTKLVNDDYIPVTKLSGSGELPLNVKSGIVDKKDYAVCLFPRNLINPALESTFIKAAKSYNSEKFNKPISAKIAYADWYIVRNDFGRIIRRTMEASIGYSENGACRSALILFAQENLGGSKFSKSQVFKVIEDLDIPCGCLK